MRKPFTALAAAGLMLALGAAPGLGAEVTHDRQPETTQSFVEEMPCVGGNADITITYRAVFHTVESDNVLHTSGKTVGSFTADPVAAGKPSYSGRFAQRFHFMSRPGAKHELGSFGFSVVGRAEDGSDSINLHETGKFVRTRNGRRVDFERSACR